MSIVHDIRPKFVGTYWKLEFLLKSELFRDKMKTPIALMLGLLLRNVACLPKDVATAIQKTETEELFRERRSASSFLNTFKVIVSVKNSLEYFIILLLQSCRRCEEETIRKLEHCSRLQLLKGNQGEQKYDQTKSTSKSYKAEMCLWDNLGNSTDLHWEASIGQVSLQRAKP